MASVPTVNSSNTDLQRMQTNLVPPMNTLLAQYNTQPMSSQSCGTFSTTSSTIVQVPNLTANFSSIGRPIRIDFLPDGSANPAYWSIHAGSAVLTIKRGNIAIANFDLSSSGGVTFKLPSSIFSLVDDSAPTGAQAYTVWLMAVGGATVTANYLIMRLSQE